MKKKRILLVINSSCGGAERVTLLYAKLLQQSGFECKLVVLHNSISDDFPMKIFIPYDLSWSLIKGKARFVPFRLLLEIKKFSPDIVFGAIMPICILLLLYKFLGLNKSRVVVRMNTTPQRIPRIQSCLAKCLFRIANAIISQTEEMKEELHKYYKLPLQLITTINNPIDKILIGEKISDTNPLDKQFYNYVAVGRLHPIKGYNTLIQAFAKVINIHKRSRLYIIGGISDILYYQQLNDLTKSLSIDKNVFFEGFQSNPYKYLYNADAFVLSSIKEGLPNALLEALYLGVPVVATRCVPFVDKIVKPGKNGFTIDPEDVNQLFSKLVEIHTIEKRKSFIDPINSEEQVKNLFEKIF